MIQIPMELYHGVYGVTHSPSLPRDHLTLGIGPPIKPTALENVCHFSENLQSCPNIQYSAIISSPMNFPGSINELLIADMLNLFENFLSYVLL